MKLLTLLLSLTASTAFAGTSDRGGGNALVCFDSPSVPKAIRTKGSPNFGVITKAALSRITKIEMLDIYQAQLARGERPNPFGDNKVGGAKPGEKPEAMADRILDRIANYAPGVHKKILEGKYALRGNISFSQDGVATIDDLNLLFSFDREKCVIATVAAQDAQNDQLFIDARLYNHPKHSIASRAAMWLHEWTYYSLLRKGVYSSAGVRGIVGRMMLAGAHQEVSSLINASVKAGLISEGRESLNGIERQVQEHLDHLKEKLTWFSDHGWHTESCPELLCDTFWKFRRQYEAEMRAFQPVQCWQLDECEKSLANFIADTQDAQLKKQAERLLSATRGNLNEMRIGERMKPFLRIDFKRELPEAYQGELLPEHEVTQAKEQYLWVMNLILSETDRRVVLALPLNRFDKFEDYQKAMKSLRDDMLAYTAGHATTANLKFPHLRLPYLGH